MMKEAQSSSSATDRNDECVSLRSLNKTFDMPITYRNIAVHTYLNIVSKSVIAKYIFSLLKVQLDWTNTERIWTGPFLA